VLDEVEFAVQRCGVRGRHGLRVKV
jgi:hypothetical protein